jgi:hypothetical protein
MPGGLVQAGVARVDRRESALRELHGAASSAKISAKFPQDAGRRSTRRPRAKPFRRARHPMTVAAAIDTIASFPLDAPRTRVALLAVVLAGLIQGLPPTTGILGAEDVDLTSTEPSDAAEPRDPWRAMDYGPFLSAAIEVAPGNIARKGLVIRLDDGAGGVARGRDFIVFDTDTLRVAGAWSGEGGIDWHSVVYDGSHGTHPKIVGELVHSTLPGPGWATAATAAFEDPRPRGRDGLAYGPLPRSHSRWRGLSLHGSRVVLHYDVAGTGVRELPGVVLFPGVPGGRGFTRSLEVATRTDDLILAVARGEPGSVAIDAPSGIATLTSVTGAAADAARAKTSFAASSPDSKLEWRASAEGDLRLVIPRGAALVRVVIAAARHGDDTPALEASVANALRDATRVGFDLAEFTKGGPSRWTEVVRTKIVDDRSTTASDPFIVEELQVPLENPYRSWMRLGGFEFLDGGRRAVVVTWMGDVWTVDGLESPSRELAWKRMATGLYQPLGVAVRDGEIFVLGRDQITRLRDHNGDGEADDYECFNNDAHATEHFHEFAMDLRTDAAGRFYYTKGGRHALDSVVPHHGTVLSVSSDGSATEIVANGFRAPNGLWVEDDGTLITSDQEGHWVPANRINRVRRGGFYGYQWSYHVGVRPETYDLPLCWIAKDFDRSPSEQLRVPKDAWGPLGGKLLSLSYGTGNVNLILEERVGEVFQGAALHLPIPIFATGIHRGRFHPRDGSLYLAGLFGWAGNRTQAGGFYRVRRTSAPLRLPIALHAVRDGVIIEWSDPLDPRRASQPGSYRVERWNYAWLERYGSDDYRVSDGEKGRESMTVRAARVSEDGRRVHLELEDMRPCMQLRMAMRLRGADGSRVTSDVWATVHALGDAGENGAGSSAK